MLRNTDGTEAFMLIDGRETPINDEYGRAYGWSRGPELEQCCCTVPPPRPKPPVPPPRPKPPVPPPRPKPPGTQEIINVVETLRKDVDAKLDELALTGKQTAAKLDELALTGEQTAAELSGMSGYVRELVDMLRHGEAFVRKVGDFDPPRRPDAP